eukprot:sb/3474836/
MDKNYTFDNTHFSEIITQEYHTISKRSSHQKLHVSRRKRSPDPHLRGRMSRKKHFHHHHIRPDCPCSKEKATCLTPTQCRCHEGWRGPLCEDVILSDLYRHPIPFYFLALLPQKNQTLPLSRVGSIPSPVRAC